MKKFVLFLSALTVLASCATPVRHAPLPPTPEEKAILAKAKVDMEAGQHEWALFDLEKFIQDHPESTLVPESHFLAGVAAKNMVDRMRADRGMDRLKNILSLSMVPVREVKAMEQALDHFLRCAETSIQDELVPRSLFMAATMADVEYLKHMENSIKLYERVFQEFPGSPWAQTSKKRYDLLQSYYRGITGTPLITE